MAEPASIRFYCPAEGCGRSFTFQEEMVKHVERRHPDVVLEEEKPAENPESPDMERSIIPEDPVETHDPKPVTTQLLLEVSGQDKLEDVTELMLRNEDLTDFNSGETLDIEDLVSLQYLSLSQNHIKDLAGVGLCLSLQELNVNYNLVESLGPLENLVELKKLFASNNLIREIVSLKSLRKLSVLSLYKNRLYDLDTSLNVLRGLPDLSVLSLDRNPCMLSVPHARYKVIRYLKIKTLDEDEITDLDVEIAADLFTKEPEQPGTSGFVSKLRGTAETEQRRELENVYQELDQLYAENESLKRENAVLKSNLGSSIPSPETEALKDEIVHLKREVANVYILLDENQELRQRLSAPLTENAFFSDVSAENERLKTRVFELEEKLVNAKKTSRRPQTSAGVLQRPKTSAGTGTASLMDVGEEEDDDLEAIISRNSESLRDLRKQLREMQGDPLP